MRRNDIVKHVRKAIHGKKAGDTITILETWAAALGMEFERGASANVGIELAVRDVKELLGDSKPKAKSEPKAEPKADESAE